MNTPRRCHAALLIALLLHAGIAAAQEPAPVGLGRVTINVVEQDISGVLRLLSEAQRVNIIAGSEVTGAVTINLYDVPFEEALTAILNIAGYTHYRVGNIVYVTTEERRSQLPLGAQDMEMTHFQLNNVEPEAMATVLQPFLSQSGSATPGIGRTLLVLDDPPRLALITRLIGEMDRPQRQVLIKVHIITVQRDDNLNIGVGFDTFPFTRYGVEALGSGFAEPFPPRRDPVTGLIPQAAIPTGTGLFAGTLQRDGRAFVEALNVAGDVEILASPQLLVLDGEPARLQVGDRLGFRITTTTETASLESVEFLEVGTVLEVTPRISADGLVQMEINPKVSSGFVGIDGLPSESTTEVSTNMLVYDGQTIVIGGLLNATKQRLKSQIPLLGDLPWIGKFFGRTNWTDDKNEVVVFLTPHIIDPQGTPEMRETADEALRRWEPLPSQGMLGPETPPLRGSPATQWRNLFQQRGAFPVQTPEAGAPPSSGAGSGTAEGVE